MKLFHTTLIALAMLIGASSTLSAQKLKDNQVPGEVMIKGKPNLVGYLELNGDEMSPWKLQKNVSFFLESALDDGKVKGKEMTKYKAKDLAGYSFDGRTFVKKYISESKLTTGIGLGKKHVLMEELAVGKISVYRLYSTPEPVTGLMNEEQRVARMEELEQIRNSPCLVLIKEGMDEKCAENIDIRDFIGDCDEVTQKYLDGGFGVEPFNTDAETKLGKFLANSANIDQMRGVIVEIVNEYNQTCGQ